MSLYVSLILLLLTTCNLLPSYADVHFIVCIWELTDLRINQPTWNLLLYMLGVNDQNRASSKLGDRHRVTPKMVCLVFLNLLSCINDTGTTECASFHPGGVTCDDARLKIHSSLALFIWRWPWIVNLGQLWRVHDLTVGCRQQIFHWLRGWRVN